MQHPEAGHLHPQWAVSYTHLDVYKRQTYEITSDTTAKVKGFFCKVNIQHAIAGLDFLLLEALAPAIGKLAFDCLLYTSRCV